MGAPKPSQTLCTRIPDAGVPTMVQEARGEYIQPITRHSSSNVRDIRVAQWTDRAGLPMRIYSEANARLAGKRLIGIWELIKPALVSALAEPIL